ncbi:sulfotransferase family 2 domain-containing protein [Mesobacterium pallidum]|uniref:sulfotransferase family 2 domain-containing protein n=1 Tax=Mesobacterium pallidum TaxID=2872037 RepID=UPI001EE23A8A|nr:sulfotransferase family 2 domain-containing protein [Mesobacterium pallidum]
MAIAVEAYRLAYMALPKAGCSSVKEALARIDPDAALPPPEAQGHGTWHALYPTARFRPHRWEQYEQRGWFRFCVVRDPIDRLLSVYSNRVDRFDELKNSPRVRALGLPTKPDPDYFFGHLRDYIEASSVIKHHAIGAWLFLGPKPLRYTRVYRTKELGQLGADLSLITGQTVTIPRANASERKVTWDELSGATRDSLRPFLDQEYEYLSEYYTNPLR